VDEVRAANGEYRVLGAGCGSLSHLDMGSGAVVTGIDILQEQLDRNEVLHEKILGDLETYPLNPGAYDVIISWDVLEHLANPRLAIDNLVGAMAPGGLLVLKLPNLLSFKGLVTRFTPIGFHVWFYRTFYKQPHAGKGSSGPFKTYLRNAVGPGALRTYLSEQGLEVVREEFEEAEIQQRIKKNSPVWGAALWTAGKLVQLVSLGKIGFDRTEYLIVMRKPA